ncbi:MAG: lipid-binding SYLF domain-containing protein, partial [Candidatus Binatia bacterium]
LLGRDENTGEWSYPAFYTLGSFNFGAQIGGQVAEVVMLIRTVPDVTSLLATKVKWGADVSVAAGIVGGGAAAKTANILVFSRTKGAFVGLTLEGAFFQPQNEWNQKYYGKPTLPEDIMIRRNVSSNHAEALRTAVTRTIHEVSALETGEINVTTPAATP